MTRTNSDISRAVHRAALERFGEADQSFIFDARTARVAPPPHGHLEVLIWRPTDELEMTTLLTIGMSARPVPDVQHRLELLFSVGRALTAEEERACARFLANMAGYPWDHRRALDFWHRLAAPGPIPCFPHCQKILFHPRLVAEGWDTVEHEGVEVRLLHPIPVTTEESALAADSVTALLRYFHRENIDLFLDRDAR
jgi:hypothetical protein